MLPLRPWTEFSLLCLPVGVWLVLAGADFAAAQRSPSCATRCGDIEVPYPFGLEEECAIHSGFHLDWTTVDGATKLLGGNVEVAKVSVQDNKAWFKTYISRQCYNQSTKGMTDRNAWINITGTPFVVSADDNKVTVLGCNGFAYMRSDDVSNLDTPCVVHSSLAMFVSAYSLF